MCNQVHHRNPLSCIIPPYMMDKIVEAEANNNFVLHHDRDDQNLDTEIRKRRDSYGKLSNDLRSTLIKSLLDNESHDDVDVDGALAPAKGLRRAIYSANNSVSLPGTLVRAEGDTPTGDTDADSVYDFAGSTYDFYKNLFGRNSVDNRGMKLVQTVHFGQRYANAMWDGKQMIYGEGDNQVFGSFTSDIDVVAHELTHGIVQYECNLYYRDQSGALNESLADVFGVMIKQKMLNENVFQSNWLVGENTLIGDNYAVRSLKSPGQAYINHPILGTDRQVAHMNNYYSGSDDNGGVHINSGIPNRAFYLAAYNVGGYAWEKVGKVWYNTMCNTGAVPANSTFSIFKHATINESIKLFGNSSNVVEAVTNAWNAVGV